MGEDYDPNAMPDDVSWEGQPRIDIEMPGIGCKWFIQLSWMMEGCIEDIDLEVNQQLVTGNHDAVRKCWVRTKVDNRVTMDFIPWEQARVFIIELVKVGFFA